MFNVGPLELMVILIVALLVVGPNRLPEVGRSIGRGLREFRKAQDEVRSTLQTALAEEPATPKVNTPPATRAGQDDGVEGSTDGGANAEGGSEPTAGSEAVDMARTLGRGLAELRRAREEIQRTFKVDLSDVTSAPKTPPAPAPKPAVPEEPAATE